jgi:hypothetical protein
MFQSIFLGHNIANAYYWPLNFIKKMWIIKYFEYIEKTIFVLVEHVCLKVRTVLGRQLD